LATLGKSLNSVFGATLKELGCNLRYTLIQKRPALELANTVSIIELRDY